VFPENTSKKRLKELLATESEGRASALKGRAIIEEVKGAEK